MCPDPPPRRSPSCWSEGTVRRSCLGGDSLAQGCTAVEPSREGCWWCPRSVQSPFAAFRRGLRTSHAFGSRGRLGRTDARGAGSLIAGGGAREQTRVRGGVGAILLCHEARPRQYRLRGRADSGAACAARGRWSGSGRQVAAFGWVPSVRCSVVPATACHGQRDGQGQAPQLL